MRTGWLTVDRAGAECTPCGCGETRGGPPYGPVARRGVKGENEGGEGEWEKGGRANLHDRRHRHTLDLRLRSPGAEDESPSVEPALGPRRPSVPGWNPRWVPAPGPEPETATQHRGEPPHEGVAYGAQPPTNWVPGLRAPKPGRPWPRLPTSPRVRGKEN